MYSALKVLILDRPDEADRMVAVLEDVGYRTEARVAQNEREFRRGMDDSVQLILADPALPGTPPVLRVMERQRLDVPVVIVAEHCPAEPNRLARDYLTKDRLDRLGGVVRRVLEEDAAERERRLLQSQRRLREAQDVSQRAQRPYRGA